MPLALRYAARSDVGLLREGNEDSGYAGWHLLAVADGMGGHAAGEVASSIAIATLADLDKEPTQPDLLARLADAVRAANAHLRDMVAGDPDLSGMGTTLTALLMDGSRFGLVHIGDSRGYLLREGELAQITRDHTFVQSLVDEGRISEAEADHHPQRSLILRALDGRDEVEPDLSIREVRVGDRYLMCSDGLSGVVSSSTIRDTLAAADSPEQAVDQLIDLALRGGGPDNITAIVADVIEVDEPADAPLTVGAAAEGPIRRSLPTTPAAAAAALSDEAGDGSDDDEFAVDDDEPEERSHWARRFLLLVVLLGLAGAGYAAWTWSQQQYFVGSDSEHVAIFRGLPDDIGPLPTSRLHERKNIAVADLPDYQRERVEADIAAANLSDAERIVRTLRKQALLCQNDSTAAPGASPTASAGPSSTASSNASTPAPSSPSSSPSSSVGGGPASLAECQA